MIITRVLSVSIVSGILASFAAAGQTPGFGLPSKSATALPPSPQAAGRASKDAPLHEWTLMVFVNGKNNLEEAALMNVNAMEDVGSTDKIHVVAQVGRLKGELEDYKGIADEWKGTRRYYIMPDGDPDRITSPYQALDEKTDMGDYTSVTDFVAWAHKNFPAKHYALVIWGHGAGWMDFPRIAPEARDKSKNIASDDATGNRIFTPALKTVLGDSRRILGRNVDLVAFDACLMQNVEVAYEIRDYTDVVVGSEETIPSFGYDYRGILYRLSGNPSADARQLGKYMVASYKEMYSLLGFDVKRQAGVSMREEYFGTTLSALSMPELKKLPGKLKTWMNAVYREAEKDPGVLKALVAARNNVLRFTPLFGTNASHSSYGDLFEFLEIVNANTPNPAVNAAGTDLMDHIISRVVIRSMSLGKATHYTKEDSEKKLPYYRRARGLSIELPQVKLSPEERIQIKKTLVYEYDALDFAKATNWGSFVTWMQTLK